MQLKIQDKKEVRIYAPLKLLLSNEQDTKGTGTTVAGYSTACFVPICGFKIIICTDSLFYSIQTFVCDGCPGNKQRFSFQIIPVCQSVLHVICKALCSCVNIGRCLRSKSLIINCVKLNSATS